jgi:Dolichyl-phosphate-mannose-protein mannosyltransferase
MRPNWWLLAAFAGATILIHFLTNREYGYFRDELYFIACGRHLAWGYVDLPPMVAALTRLSQELMGDSLSALRFFPALAGGATVAIAGILAWELGGGRFAQALAMLATLMAPIYLGGDTIMTMNAFDPIFWMGCAWALIRILKGGTPRWWLVFGLSAGLGLENKESIVFFGAALLIGLMLTRERAVLFNRWFLLGGLVAVLIAMPTAIWQWRHGFPMLEELANVAASNKNEPESFASFFAAQILLLSPASLPIWIGGLYFFLLAAHGRVFRTFGWAYLLLYAAFVILKGKVYYLAPIYPVVLGAGAVWLEEASLARLHGTIRYALPALVTAGGIAIAPNALPVLPVATFIRYEHFLHSQPLRTETSALGDLPQLYADMFGWKEMTAAVAGVYDSLPPDQRAQAAIFASNYGEAGAIDFFGPRYGLPKAISGHMSYYLWGPRDYSGKVLIAIGGRESDYRRAFASVTQAATVDAKYSMPFEHVGIFICREPKIPLKRLWPLTKIYR